MSALLNHPINKYIYALVAVILFLSITLIAFLHQQTTSHLKLETHAYDTHMASISYIAIIEEELFKIENGIYKKIIGNISQENANVKNASRHQHNIDGSIYIIRQELDKLGVINKDEDSEIVYLLQEIERKYENLSAVKNSSDVIKENELYLDQAEDLILPLAQFSRLHQIKLKALLADIRAIKSKNTLNIILFLIIFIIFSAIIITKIFSFINKVIEKQEETDKFLRNTNTELELRVDARTEELQKKNLQLDIALHKAEESTRSKSEFLANMSHEIRTPMNGVLGMLDLLNDTTLDPKQKDFVETASSSGHTLLTLLNDILDISKIEAGKLELEHYDFDLREAIEDVTTLLAGHASAKNIELMCDIASDIPSRVNGDPVRLRQILTNLTGNAIKFTKHGEVIITADLQNQTGESIVVRFKVKDTGIGIPKEAQKHIFDAFSQVDGSITRRFGGTGLGLNISQQLVEMMNGEIDVESIPGKGSTFWFTAHFSPAETMPLKNIPDVDMQKLRALIVDDNRTNRQVLQNLLSNWHIKHSSAESGYGALRILSEHHTAGHPFDVVLLDMMMPGMDGLELASRIKNNPQMKNIKFILLTSLSHPGHSIKVKQAGIKHNLPKPVRQSQLFDALASVIHAPDSNQLNTKQKDDETPVPAISDKQILIVEDNIINQKVVLGMLKNIGYKADLANNGEEALKILEQQDYDLVFMDCQMPVLDGYKTTREIRRKEEDTDTHQIIVAMTANALSSDREKCLTTGMDDYIPKPINPALLRETLEKWLLAGQKEQIS